MTRKTNRWFALAAVALLGPLAACGELDVTNPNAPERERAFSDPATIVASAAGTMKTWMNTKYAYSPSLTLAAMADHTSFSWNNFNSRYYSSYGVDCANRCAWVNSTSTQLGQQVEPYWYGMYSLLSSANDALFAIRKSSSPPDLGAQKDAVETISQMAQGIAHAFIALNYDQGFVVKEDTDVLALQLQPRGAIRDAAMTMLEAAYTLANTKTFSTGATWFGVPTGPVYTSKQLAKAIRTMQAELLAHYPRNSEENAQVNWGQVLTYASQGVSSAVNAPAFNFEAYQDQNGDFFTGYHRWANDYTTVRVDTRVARLFATNQIDPWPGGNGNPQPNAGIYGLDRRVGDGCFGPEDDYLGNGGCKATPNSGTDFAWSPLAIFIPGRGSFHQSNMGYVREHCLSAYYDDCPTGEGPIPVYSKVFNDLLWAEALLRTNGSATLAAEKINNSRVGKGGLPALTGGEGTQALLRALIYEQEVGLYETAPAPYFNRRRYTSSAQVVLPEAYNRMWPDTPRQMPVPAKDLQLLRAEIYSFGGPTNPGGAAPSVNPLVGNVKNVREIWAEIEKQQKQTSRRRR
ncbi:MAG: hypothetical protein FJ206_14610 [Gemmatimonadetes bacterium]|nr:hypothetical protein [Gemmatimonadota bacterium]